MRTSRLVCDRFTMEHVDALAVMDRDAEVQQWLFGKTYTAEETKERAQRRVSSWDEHGAGDYIVHTNEGEFIGFAGFFPSPRPDAIAIGYALVPEHWGHGYGTELALLLTDTARSLGRAEIVATVRDTNTASRRILEKAGFTPIGRGETEAETLLYRLQTL
jgi:RimJ/RimL family protein N-acetyltransferase